MSDLNLEYSSAQDKLLIMLLERITALEGVISKQSATLSELVSMSTSDVFTLCITGKYTNDDLEDMTKVEEQILSIINDIVPCRNIYISKFDYVGGSLALHTQKRYLLRSIETLLNQKLSTVVDFAGSWKMKCPGWDTESMKNYRVLGVKIINSDTQ